MKKKIAIYCAFFIIIALIIGGLDRMFSIKSQHGIFQAEGLYDQPRNSIDMVWMGSSHIHCDINTAYLWKNYGIAAYDYSAAEQPLWGTYFYLKEFCKYQSPKVMVLDLFSPARYSEPYQYDFLYDNLQGMRFSVNKLQMLMVSAEPSRWADYCPDFVTYHNRYEELKPEDYKAFWGKEDRSSFKGYTPYFDIRPQERPELKETRSGDLDMKSELYLSKIIDYAEKKGIKLYFIVTPYITNDKDELIYNRIHEIAVEKGIPFNSTNYDYDAIGLDFSKDFNDESHLNYVGSCKFTEYIARDILRIYGEDLKDHRGDSRYNSWDEHVKAIDREVEAHEKKADASE